MMGTSSWEKGMGNHPIDLNLTAIIDRGSRHATAVSRDNKVEVETDHKKIRTSTFRQMMT